MIFQSNKVIYKLGFLYVLENFRRKWGLLEYLIIGAFVLFGFERFVESLYVSARTFSLEKFT